MTLMAFDMITFFCIRADQQKQPVETNPSFDTEGTDNSDLCCPRAFIAQLEYSQLWSCVV